MSTPGRIALVYQITLARSSKWEAEHSATVRVIPPAGDASSSSDQERLSNSYSLGIEAIHNLDPELERMIVTRTSEVEVASLGDGFDASEAALEKDGWRVFIEWVI